MTNWKAAHMRFGIWASVFCPQNNTSHLQTTGRRYLFPTLDRPHLYHLSTKAQALLHLRLHPRETTVPPCLAKQPSWGTSAQGCHDRVCSFTPSLLPTATLRFLASTQWCSRRVLPWHHREGSPSFLSVGTAFWQKHGSVTVTNQEALSPMQIL